VEGMEKAYSQIAKEIVQAVGGKENIVSFAHCATRLRIVVNDKDKVDTQAIENVEMVKGVFYNSGQYQIIFGTGTVNRVYEAVEGLGISGTTKAELKAQAQKQGNAFQRAVRALGDVFVPIIPALVATGLFMGLRGLLTQDTVLGWLGMTQKDIPANFILFTQIVTDTAFAFLPALIAWSAFKVFGGSPVLGIVLGLMLVNPGLPNAYAVGAGSAEPLKFFGFINVAGYQGSVLPAFFVGLLGAKLEQQIRKRMPESIDLLVTPFLTLLITVALGLFVLGPILHLVESILLVAVQAIIGLPFGIGGLTIGGIIQVIVVTGVHQIFQMVEIQLLANTHWNPYNGIVAYTAIAQGAATLAFGLKTKNKKIKALAIPSALSAFLGITEPAIFGVNLRYFKPFVMGLIGGAVGGFLGAIFHVKATGMGLTGIPGVLLYLNNQIFLYIAISLITFAVSFILTWKYGCKEEIKE
jgi:sucrose PTS system EIIBCA or EIIBC component